jgi:hypothetical protein
VDDVAAILNQLTAIKKDVENWKASLPSYYEAITVPISGLEFSDAYWMYPYTERLDYVTGKITYLSIC